MPVSDEELKRLIETFISGQQAIQRELSGINNTLLVIQEDQKAMKEQLNRIESGQETIMEQTAATAEELHAQKERIDNLEKERETA